MKDGSTIIDIYKSIEHSRCVDYSQHISFNELCNSELKELKSILVYFINKINEIIEEQA